MEVGVVVEETDEEGGVVGRERELGPELVVGESVGESVSVSEVVDAGLEVSDREEVSVKDLVEVSRDVVVESEEMAGIIGEVRNDL